jgi:hypothetical protein
MKTQTIPLSSLYRQTKNCHLIAKLKDGKQILRVLTPRLVRWFLLFPAKGGGDVRALLIEKTPGFEHIGNVQKALLASYADRIAQIY